MDNVLMEGINQMPIGWRIWINWMMIINSASIFFVFRHTEARIVLGVWLLNAGAMMVAAEAWGFIRLLGLVHVIFWTPLMVYLIAKRKTWVTKKRINVWLWVVIATDCVSLAMDYVDVARYILGDRGTA